MKEDDRMRAFQLTERVQHKIEFYLNHSNDYLHSVATQALIATNLEVILIERQLNECKKTLKEHNLPSESDAMVAIRSEDPPPSTTWMASVITT